MNLPERDAGPLPLLRPEPELECAECGAALHEGEMVFWVLGQPFDFDCVDRDRMESMARHGINAGDRMTAHAFYAELARIAKRGAQEIIAGRPLKDSEVQP